MHSLNVINCNQNRKWEDLIRCKKILFILTNIFFCYVLSTECKVKQNTELCIFFSFLIFFNSGGISPLKGLSDLDLSGI